MQFLKPPIIDPDGERAREAMDNLRETLARGISLPPKMMTETNPPARPIWIGIDWAKGCGPDHQ